ncbi:hypothetical protein BGW39_007420 [Mortierella sp. 14UC]|nr:hypothetical protein BGW39_007420 [Mortierella sp. 14UC]
MFATTSNPPPPTDEPPSFFPTVTTATPVSLSPSAVMISIPELASALARHLSKHELTICIRINNAWRDALVTHLWETVRILGPSLVSLRTLKLDEYLDWDLYDKTTLMTVWVKNNNTDRLDTTSVLVNIFRRNPDLHTVKLAMAAHDDYETLADALGRLRELEHLVLGDDLFKTRSFDFESVMEACTRSGCLLWTRIDSAPGLHGNAFEFMVKDTGIYLDSLQEAVPGFESDNSSSTKLESN